MVRQNVLLVMLSAVVCLSSIGCDSEPADSSPKKSDEPTTNTGRPAVKSPPDVATPATPTAGKSSTLPAKHPPTGKSATASAAGRAKTSAPAGAKIEGATLNLTGLVMTIPDGWLPDPITPGPMAPKAIFKLAGAGGDSEGCLVRVTHFPGMKGLDRQNVDRWISQVRQPDGSSSTREHAKLTTKENGNVRLTIVDIAGSVNTAMDGVGAAKSNRRLLAAIVDHPKGPHFVKVEGDSATVQKWESTVLAFIESARVN